MFLNRGVKDRKITEIGGVAVATVISRNMSDGRRLKGG
jgi:hypothetical protein